MKKLSKKPPVQKPEVSKPLSFVFKNLDCTMKKIPLISETLTPGVKYKFDLGEEEAYLGSQWY